MKDYCIDSAITTIVVILAIAVMIAAITCFVAYTIWCLPINAVRVLRRGNKI